MSGYDTYKDFYSKQQSVLDRNEKINNWKNTFTMHGLFPDKDAEILEIGCADGILLEYLKSLGYKNISGIEYCEDLAKEVRLKELDVVSGDAVEILKASPKKYDVIYMFDVIEHIEKDKQIDFLKSLNEHLNEDGFLAFSAPNALTPISSYFRYADFTHTCAYTEASLNYILQNANFPSPSIRCSHIESELIIKLKRPWYKLCKHEYNIDNVILTPIMFAVSYKKLEKQEEYDKKNPKFYNDYNTQRKVFRFLGFKITIGKKANC